MKVVLKKVITKIFALADDLMLLRFVDRIVSFYVGARGGDVVQCSKYGQKDVIGNISMLRDRRKILLTNSEALNLALCVKNTKKIRGETAEVGVFEGGSASIIAAYKGDRRLYLFDTFNGIPSTDQIDEPDFCVGQFKVPSAAKAPLDLGSERNVFVFQGVFPESAGEIECEMFSFVHIDVDTYKSTFECIAFFYSRVSPGGVILVHDYSSHYGVWKAVNDFFQGKNETVLGLLGTQALIVKL